MASWREPRPGKQVWQGEQRVKRAGIGEPLRFIFRVTRRTTDAKGQVRMIPEVEVETYWTSLDVGTARVIELYHAHGTSEQFHSELKTDLDLERLPSGKFQTNELVLLLGMMAYNLLRLIGQESLGGNDVPIRKRPFRRRIRSVMQDLIYLACRMVKDSRRLLLSFGRHSLLGITHGSGYTYDLLWFDRALVRRGYTKRVERERVPLKGKVLQKKGTKCSGGGLAASFSLFCTA